MGGCTSKSAAPVSADVARRRALRKSSSKDQLQRQLEAYHARPQQPSPNFEKLRPTPIIIANPNAFDANATKVSLVGSPVLVLDSTSSSMNNSSMALNISTSD